LHGEVAADGKGNSTILRDKKSIVDGLQYVTCGKPGPAEIGNI
jgi:hypothetical protein